MKIIPTILGPTASGKTNLSVRLAKKINGEVIGLDSRQIYKNIPIGTAQPTKKEMEGIVHHLVGNKPLGQSVSAGQYAKLVYKCIEKIWNKGKKPIVCGGAGLYYRALNKGIFDESKTDLKIRKKLEKMYDDGRALEMHSELKKIDPQYSLHVHINNKKRLIRALEIYNTTGKSPSNHFKSQKNKLFQDLKFLSIYLNWDRDVLKKRIFKRTSKLIKIGWIEEVKKLINEYPSFDIQPLDSIGYSQIALYLKNQLSLEDLELEIGTKTYQYAVKQIKWFKKENIDLIVDMESENPFGEIVDKVVANLI